MIKKTLIALTILFLIPVVSEATTINSSVTRDSRGFITTNIPSDGLSIPGIASSTTGCLSIQTGGWISPSGSSCGSSTGVSNPFFRVAGGNATTTLDYFYGGIYVLGSTTIQYASTTQVSADSICLNSDTCRTTWPSGGSGTYPFTPTTNYAAATNATSGIVWFQNGLQASSTSYLVYASTTAITAQSANILRLDNLTAGFVKSSANGTLSVDTNTYLTGNQTITLSGDVTGSGATAITTVLDLTLPHAWTGLQTFKSASSTSFSSLDGLYIGRTATTSIVGDLGTSTFSSRISAVSASTTATSTMAGINLPYGGCFAVGGTCITSGGAGTVTSVAASVPSIFSISGSPITTSGTLAMTYSGTALPLANGGTNATSFTTSGNAVYYNGSTLATALTTAAVTTPYASTTALTSTGSAYFATSNGTLSVGTTTSVWALTVASSSAGQISLSEGAGIPQLVQRWKGGQFTLSSTTLAGTATTTPPAFMLDTNASPSLSIGTTTLFNSRDIMVIGTSTLNVGTATTTITSEAKCYNQKAQDGSWFSYYWVNRAGTYSQIIEPNLCK